MTPEIEEFAKMLVQWVRDESIQNSDMILRPTVSARIAQRWRDAASEGNPTAFARVLIPDVVDTTIFYLLYAIDEGLLPLTYTAENGNVVDLTEQGLSELAGWYMGSDSWRERFSKERFDDDFADLKGGS